MNTPETNTKLMLDTFDLQRDQIDDLEKQVLALSRNGPNAQETSGFSDWLFCIRLSITLYTEANAAVQAGAWFAAATVAAAALESVLLGKCFLHQEEVRALPKWRSVKKSYNLDFGAFARSLDLGKLLDIAKQLSWFPSEGVPESFRKMIAPYLDEDSVNDFIKVLQDTSDVGQTCADQVRQYRNLIHPAVCLKEGKQPSPKVGLTAAFMFLIALSSLSKQ